MKIYLGNYRKQATVAQERLDAYRKAGKCNEGTTKAVAKAQTCTHPVNNKPYPVQSGQGGVVAGGSDGKTCVCADPANYVLSPNVGACLPKIKPQVTPAMQQICDAVGGQIIPDASVGGQYNCHCGDKTGTIVKRGDELTKRCEGTKLVDKNAAQQPGFTPATEQKDACPRRSVTLRGAIGITCKCSAHSQPYSPAYIARVGLICDASGKWSKPSAPAAAVPKQQQAATSKTCNGGAETYTTFIWGQVRCRCPDGGLNEPVDQWNATGYTCDKDGKMIDSSKPAATSAAKATTPKPAAAPSAPAVPKPAGGKAIRADKDVISEVSVPKAPSKAAPETKIPDGPLTLAPLWKEEDNPKDMGLKDTPGIPDAADAYRVYGRPTAAQTGDLLHQWNTSCVAQGGIITTKGGCAFAVRRAVVAVPSPSAAPTPAAPPATPTPKPTPKATPAPAPTPSANTRPNSPQKIVYSVHTVTQRGVNNPGTSGAGNTPTTYAPAANGYMPSNDYYAQQRAGQAQSGGSSSGSGGGGIMSTLGKLAGQLMGRSQSSGRTSPPPPPLPNNGTPLVPKTTPKAQCESFTADKTEITAGEGVTLTWELKNAATNMRMRISPIVTVSFDKERNRQIATAHPESDVTYTLKVWHEGAWHDLCQTEKISVTEDDDDDDPEQDEA